MRVRLSKDDKVTVETSKDIYGIMQRILLREYKLDRDREHFWVVCLDDKSSIALIELMYFGNSSFVGVRPTEIFSFALQKGADSIILVHNHPITESLEPSPEDMDVTDRLLQNSIFLKTPIVDHLIINENEYYSFADKGDLEKLRESKKYIPPYQQFEDRIRQEGEETGKILGELEGLKKGKKEGIKIGIDTSIKFH